MNPTFKQVTKTRYVQLVSELAQEIFVQHYTKLTPKVAAALADKYQSDILTDDEIRFIIRGFTDGSIPDYQMSAFAMTVFYKGMTDHETAVLTDAMMHSGDTVDLSRFGDKSVDKHSTGGVGDKTTLIVAPIVSSLGGKMAKMSGRGLGHTGGTVDKLESIPGYQTCLLYTSPSPRDRG